MIKGLSVTLKLVFSYLLAVLCSMLLASCGGDGTTQTTSTSVTFSPWAESFDDGQTWSEIDSLNFAKELHCGAFGLSANVFLIGGKDTTNKAAIWRSTDNGYNWVNIFTMSNGATSFNDMEYVSANRIYAAASDGSIYKSTDDGLTWSVVYSANAILNDIDFDGTLVNGIAVGANGKIVLTSNSGNTWTTVSPVTTQNLNAACYIGNDSIAAVGNNKTIILSGDGGVNWTVGTISGSYADLKSIDFSQNANGRFGMAGGSNGHVFKTTDGGATWNIFFPSGITTGDIEDIITSSTGYCLVMESIGGASVHTQTHLSTDKGVSWSPSFNIPNVFLDRFVFRSDIGTGTYGFVVGIK